MKILFVNNFEKPDYQNDTIYHGLINTPGVFVYETAWPGYMLRSYSEPSSLYGKGFTLYARMAHTPRLCAEWVIREKIRDRHYDYIIYGSVYRDQSYIDAVTKNYSKEKIIFIDGEDEPEIKCPNLLNQGIYFKRELCSPMYRVRPISFSIPEEHVKKTVPNKHKPFATVIPGDLSTYIFENEKDYFNDYAQSYYAKTEKKWGYDCMRHYEILASGCIPAFKDLDKVPDTVMTSFPKGYLKPLQKNAFDGKYDDEYKNHVNWLLDYCRNNLTTVKEVRRLLERIS